MDRADRIAWAKLIGLGLLFTGLSLAGIAWVVGQVPIDWIALAETLRRAPMLGGLALALAALLIFAEMARYKISAQIIDRPLSWWACWDAAIANNFFAWLTPGAALSEPATLYVLGRRGMRWGDALVVTYVKGLSSSALFVMMAALLLAAGFGPKMAPQWYIPFVWGTSVIGLFSGLILAMAFFDVRALRFLQARSLALEASARLRGWPRLLKLLLAIVQTCVDSIERLAALRQAGALALLPLLAAHLFYYCCFLGVFLALTWAFEQPEVGALLGRVIIYQCFTYMAPTPGGAGLSEGLAVAFFEGLLRPETAAIVVLLYRSLTFYFHILLGAAYLPSVGGVMAVLKGGGKKPAGQSDASERGVGEEE